ncbi:MAG TPA: hypothetical protein VK524_08135, partial [Polyangiaceae bacterium]|nr:hypothetical protein [Polyangiaceae bacterium]
GAPGGETKEEVGSPQPTAPQAESFDTSFGENGSGIARVSFGNDDGGSFSDVQLRGQDLVLAGTGFGGLGGSRFAVTHLTAGGALDPEFAGGTLVKLGFAGSTGSYAYAVGVGQQSTGSTVALGWHELGVNPGNIALARWSDDGSAHDFTGGSNGKLELDLGGAEQIEDGLVLPDDHLLLAGQRDGQLLVVRITPDGLLDPSFGGTGYVTLAWESEAGASALAVDAENRIVVVGQVGAEGQRDVTVARLLDDGHLDSSFGSGGRVRVVRAASDDRSAALSVQQDGSVLVAGDTRTAAQRELLLIQLTPDGSLDTTYGSGGSAVLATGFGDDTAEDVLVMADGRALVAANAHAGGTTQPTLIRLSSAGKADPSFGEGGILALNLGEYGRLERVLAYPGGRVLVTGGDEGMTPGPGTYGVVARIWL